MIPFNFFGKVVLLTQQSDKWISFLRIIILSRLENVCVFRLIVCRTRFLLFTILIFRINSHTLSARYRHFTSPFDSRKFLFLKLHKGFSSTRYLYVYLKLLSSQRSNVVFSSRSRRWRDDTTSSLFVSNDFRISFYQSRTFCLLHKILDPSTSGY